MPRKRLPARLHLLSVRAVQTAGDGDHSDGGNLMLRARGGSATWVFRYTAATGKRREMGLGPVHRSNPAQTGLSLTCARELAAEARTLLQRGVDPIDERDQRRVVQREAVEQVKAAKTQQAMTLARAARDYHQRVIEPSRTPKHAAQWISSLENHMPAALWHAPVSTITAPALLTALTAIQPHERARNLTADARLQETVQRIRQRLDAVFEDASFHGWCSTNPAAAVRRKVREGMPRRERGQFAALPYREAPEFMCRLRAAEGVAARALEFAILTAARTSEVIGATWQEIDLDTALWVVPAARMKAGEDHAVYLTPRAVSLLRDLQQLGKAYVFPSPRLDGGPLSNMALLAVLGRMGERERTTVHGLCRATFSTWANETGAGRPDVIEACLAHEEGNRVRRAYNRAGFADERRTLLQAWTDFLSTCNVVTMPRAK
ncbi:tyrosine-type recombinase/integrase [Aquincola tertiaricarbonis]|uniref:tyrosine-type recombinase/integrase n=1 Tax=Aquincola tertiaricarbonis TaxID=391953 RepID=UPI000696EEBB|nr:site-specific integrase [Aquincola tertiaricarbonis]